MAKEPWKRAAAIPVSRLEKDLLGMTGMAGG